MVKWKKMFLIAFSLLLLFGVVGAVRAQDWLSPGSDGVAPPYAVARALTEEEAAAGKEVQVQYFDSFEEAMQSVGAAPADFQNSEPERHCVVQIEPLQPDQQASVMLEPACFDSFSEAIYAATKGAVRLAPTTKPSELTPQMLALASTTVIGIDYSSPNYQGSSLVWVVNNTVGCNTGYSYVSPTMPSGWNDVVSSARTYGGCINNPHYEHTYYGGAVLNCTCATMGVMDNATSSEKWYR